LKAVCCREELVAQLLRAGGPGKAAPNIAFLQPFDIVDDGGDSWPWSPSIVLVVPALDMDGLLV